MKKNSPYKYFNNIFPRERVIEDESGLYAYSYDNSRIRHQPDLVVFPQNEQEVKKTVKSCIEHGLPLTVRGRGTATTGAAVPIRGGVVLSCERFNRIVEIDEANRFAVVEPGVTGKELEKSLLRHGLFWGPNPTSLSFSSIGGNIACNSAGSRTLKYGAVRDNILGVKFVSGAGKIITGGKPVSKISSGYDIAGLIAGSEGTLGIMTAAILKLTPVPKYRMTARALYRDIQSASRAVANICGLSSIPAAIEFLDKGSIGLIVDKMPELQSANAMLLMEIDGDDNREEHMKAVANAAQNEGMIEFLSAENEEEKAKLWQARKILSPKLRDIAPKKINEDVAVPVSRIPELNSAITNLGARFRLKIVSFGHIGNGNLHVNILINPDDEEENNRAQSALSELLNRVISLRGTISGEHGIGLVKREFLELEHDRATRELFGKIKTAFDPHGILNPGKGFA